MKSEDHWMSVSDLMAGLMMVFLFISISLLVKERSKVKNIQDKINETNSLYKKMKDVLTKEFKKDFKRWGMDWDKSFLADGTIRFESPRIIFSAGSYELKPRFKEILKSFCPRYVKKLQNSFKSEKIHEIRIIGHASSDWNTRRHKTKAFENVKLSIKRALVVHEFCYQEIGSGNRQWLSKKTTTIGAGFVHLRKDHKGKEKKHSSRRVEFKVEFKPFSELREKFFKAKKI